MQLVTTLTGTKYLVNDNDKTITRFAAQESGPLRRDSEPVSFMARSGILVGQVMSFVLTGVIDEPGTLTTRVTTPVVEIDLFDEDGLAALLAEGSGSNTTNQ